MRIGIPRALLYYDYWPLWERFFRDLGCEVVTSPQTTAEIADLGVRIACDEACYPVKLLHGHVLELCQRGVDLLFMPKVVSMQPGTYSCPKLIGITDMVRFTIPNLPPIIDPTINLRLGTRGVFQALRSAADGICANPAKVYRAFRSGMADLRNQQQRLHSGRILGVKGEQHRVNASRPVAVIGHPYDLYDPYLNLNLLQRLTDLGHQVYTPEMLPERVLQQANRQLRKQLFWSLSRRVIGAAIHFSEREDVRGIIQISSFGCGLESLVADMAERVARRQSKPFMLLTVDEHAGEAGMHTRLEAFLDMLTWREEISCV